MKNKINLLLLSLVFLASISNAQQKVSGFAADSSTLWKKSTLRSWIKHYQYEGYYQTYNSGQVANVLEIDLNDPEAQIVFADSKPSDSLSSVVKGIPNSLAAVNGTYYEIVADGNVAGGSVSSSFFKTGNTVLTEVTVPEDHRLFWKHEGHFIMNHQASRPELSMVTTSFIIAYLFQM